MGSSKERERKAWAKPEKRFGRICSRSMQAWESRAMGWEMKLERFAEPRSRRGLCDWAKQGGFNPGCGRYGGEAIKELSVDE